MTSLPSGRHLLKSSFSGGVHSVTCEYLAKPRTEGPRLKRDRPELCGIKTTQPSVPSDSNSDKICETLDRGIQDKVGFGNKLSYIMKV